MNLEWNIKEIKLRIKEIINKLKKQQLDETYLRLYDELLELSSMTYFINGSISEPKNIPRLQQQFIYKYYKGQSLEGIKEFKKNRIMHENLSRKIIETFNKVRFHCYDGDLERISITKNIQLVRDFIGDYDIEQFNYFEHLINNDCINISNRKLNFYDGITFSSSQKSYILCENFGNLSLAVTLVHEYGHAYASLKNNHQLSNKNLNLSEINSHYMEYMFLNFLIKNDLFKEDALLIQNLNYKDLYLRSLKLLVLTAIDNLKCNESYNIINDSEEIKKDISKLQNINHKELQQFASETLNIDEILKYMYGNLMGLIYFNKYGVDKDKTLRELNDVIKGQTTLNDIVTTDGLDKQLILNNKRMN